MSPVALAPHDPNWRIAFHRARVAVRNALGTTLLQMHHIGATSVPGMPARPIIDLLGVVSNLDTVDLRGGALAAIGYVTQRPDDFDSDRAYCRESNGDALETTVRLLMFGSPRIAAAVTLTQRLRDDARFFATFAQRKSAIAAASADWPAYRAAMRELFGTVTETPNEDS
jgi:GrpB-like predicted nucleotidyltransferase (UPF0157 family)